uniref:SPAT7 protein n=1 Tax=Syphacia muris TaxID=451379 RepID=A0A0N5AZ84_9BILA
KYFRKHKAALEAAAATQTQEKSVVSSDRTTSDKDISRFCDTMTSKTASVEKKPVLERHRPTLNSVEEKAALIIQNAFRKYRRNLRYHRYHKNNATSFNEHILSSICGVKCDMKKRRPSLSNESSNTRGYLLA